MRGNMLHETMRIMKTLSPVDVALSPFLSHSLFLTPFVYILYHTRLHTFVPPFFISLSFLVLSYRSGDSYLESLPDSCLAPVWRSC